jgi:hypothetical protein
MNGVVSPSPLMLDHIQIHVHAIGAENGDAPLQLLPRPEPGGRGSLLVPRAYVAVIEGALPVGAGAGSRDALEHRRQPHGRKSHTPELGRPCCQMIPPPRHRDIAVCRRRDGVVRSRLEEALQEDAHRLWFPGLRSAIRTNGDDCVASTRGNGKHLKRHLGTAIVHPVAARITGIH